MNKDYAKKRRLTMSSRRSRAARAYGNEYVLMPAWAWMIAGLLLGVVLSGIAYVKMHAKTPPVANLTVEIEEVDPKQIAQAPEKKRMHYDFYTLLPSGTSDAPAPETAQAEPVKPNEEPQQLAEKLADPIPADLPVLKQATAADPKDANDPYIIQAGSFKSLSQAEELKAQLAMSGFEASVQTFKKNENETLYRVFLGPFTSKDKALEQQIQLEQALQLHSLVVKNRV